jgi:hypothetical protein
MGRQIWIARLADAVNEPLRGESSSPQVIKLMTQEEKRGPRPRRPRARACGALALRTPDHPARFMCVNLTSLTERSAGIPIFGVSLDDT